MSGYYATIDKDKLDDELLFISTEWDALCMLKEKRIEELRDMDESISAAEAKIRLEIVKDPAKYGLPKSTEALAEAKTKELLATHYINRSKIKNALDDVTMRMSSLDMRRRSVELLIQLFLNSYYGDCRVKPREAIV